MFNDLGKLIDACFASPKHADLRGITQKNEERGHKSGHSARGNGARAESRPDEFRQLIKSARQKTRAETSIRDLAARDGKISLEADYRTPTGSLPKAPEAHCDRPELRHMEGFARTRHDPAP